MVVKQVSGMSVHVSDRARLRRSCSTPALAFDSWRSRSTRQTACGRGRPLRTTTRTPRRPRAFRAVAALSGLGQSRTANSADEVAIAHLAHRPYRLRISSSSGPEWQAKRERRGRIPPRRRARRRQRCEESVVRSGAASCAAPPVRGRRPREPLCSGRGGQRRPGGRSPELQEVVGGADQQPLAPVL